VKHSYYKTIIRAGRVKRLGLAARCNDGEYSLSSKKVWDKLCLDRRRTCLLVSVNRTLCSFWKLMNMKLDGLS
jgi:hypothetical protein